MRCLLKTAFSPGHEILPGVHVGNSFNATGKLYSLEAGSRFLAYLADYEGTKILSLNMIYLSLWIKTIRTDFFTTLGFFTNQDGRLFGNTMAIIPFISESPQIFWFSM